MSVTAAPRTTARDPGPFLWAVTGVAWVGTLGLMAVPAAMGTMPAIAVSDLAAGTSSRPAAVALFAGGWIVMVAAMMLPTTVPMARMVTVVTSDVPARRRVLTAFFGAYLSVWVVAGLLGLGAAALVARATAGAVPGHLVLAGALALAGAFQFSPLKQRCLTLCRDPRAFLFTRYRRGVGAAWSLAMRHALTCLGCCWALMAVMFAVGTGGVAWMLGLTAVMVAEKNAPWGRRLVAPIGVALLVAAVVLAAGSVYGVPTTGAGTPPMHM